MVQGAAARNRRLSQGALGNAMALAFYYASGSPYAWRVWLALEHKGIPYERKTLSFAADFTPYPYVALVLRMGKRKPGLVTGDLSGPAISAWTRRMEALPVTRKTWPPHWK